MDGPGHIQPIGPQSGYTEGGLKQPPVGTQGLVAWGGGSVVPQKPAGTTGSQEGLEEFTQQKTINMAKAPI